MSEERERDWADEEGDDGEGDAERRGEQRHLACFPAHLETAEGVPRSALIRDLSVSGALLLTRARLRVGDVVKLALHLREGLPPYDTSARVVREERRPNELVHPWTKAVAVQFEAPIAALEGEAKALAERQASLFHRSANK
jgi:hypothetical protein